jgi:hypothetical protein
LPKIVKIPLIVLAIVLAIALIALGIAQTAWFKNYATNKAINFLSEELQVKVDIEEVSINYFDEINAKKIIIHDQQNDTMIFIESLVANYDLWSFSSDIINIDKIELDHANVRLGIPKGQKKINIQFLIDYFTAPKSSGPKNAPILSFDEIVLENTYFNYFNSNLKTPTSRRFNETDMKFSNINGTLKDFEIIKDSIQFTIQSISASEASGFVVSNLSAETTISRQRMNFQDLKVTTDQSNAVLDLEFRYNDYPDFSDFINIVKIKSNFKEGTVHTSDIAYFTDELIRYNEELSLKGIVTGTISDITGKNLSVRVGNHTSYQGFANLKGLPEITETVFDLNTTSFKSNTKDIARLIELNPTPKEFINVGEINFTGSFNGYYNNFKLLGNLNSDVGNISTNLAYKTDPEHTYVGVISSDYFDLNQLLELDYLGSTSFNLDIDGSGIDANSLIANVDGTINHITYDNYSYQDISINGRVTENIYKGNFNINDPNYNLSFNGSLDASSDVSKIDINTNVRLLNLKSLGLDTTNAYVKFRGKIDVTGSDVNNIHGHTNLKNFTFIKGSKNYQLKKVKISSIGDSITVNTDLGTASLSGDYLNSELSPLIGHISYLINPVVFDTLANELESKNITLRANLNEYHPLYKEFIADLYFDSSSIYFSYDHFAQKITSRNKVYSPDYLSINSDWALLTLNNSGPKTPINFGINTNGLHQKDSILFDELNAHGFINDGLVNFETTSKKDTVLDIILTGRYLFQNDSSIVYLDDTEVEIYGTPWTLRNTEFPNIVNHDGITEFLYFDFRYKDEIMFLDASIGNNADKLNLFLTNFRLANLMPFFSGYDIHLDGSANGYLDISDRDGHPIIESDFVVENLQMNDDTLGNLVFNSTATDQLLVVDIAGHLESGLLNDLSILGKINFNNKNSPLNLNLTTDSASLKPFEKYLVDLASDIEGYSTTNINISGPLNRPKLRGTMRIDGLDFVVDYLQTRYTGDALLDISHNAFTIQKATIFDQLNSPADVSGKVSHQNFTDYLFDIKIEKLNNFEIMNTTREDNELFYGTAFVDGNMRISGPLDDILMQINAKSRKGTKIEIPLDNFETSGKLSYVEFVDIKKDNNAINQAITNMAGVQMDFNFEVTNDAQITLVFDELLGDKIEAAGHGNIRMEINTYGDFNMYGGLTIDQGNYLFTAFDLINKYFVVKPGGTLFWDGNPYNATINLEATKREYPVPKTLLLGMLSEEELVPYSEAIPADCHLILKGLLFNPEVAFDLSFPSQLGISGTSNTALTTVIDRIKLDPEELNRQVFALLVLGSFIPPSFANPTDGQNYSANDGVKSTGWNSLSDLASSQLNNWLSQLDTRWQVGLDYQYTEEERDELILSLKRKFFNDRLELGYSFDAGAVAGTRPYDFNVQYNLSEDGNFKIRGFQKNANDPTLGNINTITTTGLGFFYRYQFDKFRIRRKKKKVD